MTQPAKVLPLPVPPRSDTRDIRHKAIRAALKAAFPAVKFSVRGSTGTAYGWTRIGWTDGPSDARVSAIVAGFIGSRFDGMDDAYHSTHNVYTYQGVTYRAGGQGYNTKRRISKAFLARIRDAIGQAYNVPASALPAIDPDDKWGARFAPPESSPIVNWDGDHHWTYQAIARRAAEDRTTLAD